MVGKEIKLNEKIRRKNVEYDESDWQKGDEKLCAAIFDICNGESLEIGNVKHDMVIKFIRKRSNRNKMENETHG